jgi:hypothetical protein
VVIEAGVVAGYVIAWAVRKARRAIGQLDNEADLMIDAGLNQLHEMVADRLAAWLWEGPPAAGEATPRRGQRCSLGTHARRLTGEPGIQAGDGALGIETAKQVSVYQQFTVSREPGRAGGMAYLQQVRRIAPPELVGRETELAELVAFCLDPDRGPYAWWRRLH